MHMLKYVLWRCQRQTLNANFSEYNKFDFKILDGDEKADLRKRRREE